MRKGVHIYTEQEIEQASGTEKERRQWWNEKAKEMCENPQCDMLRGEAINQRLHKEWKIHKAEKMAEEEMQTREATEAILEECPNLQGLVDRKSKSKQRKTRTRNLKRLELAVQTARRSQNTLQELSVQLQNTDKRGAVFQELKKKFEEHKESHRFHYRELNKAQSKVLSIKTIQLREPLEKRKDSKAE